MMNGTAPKQGNGRSDEHGQPATIGPYRVVRRIGEGGMGVVYEGLHEALARRVAIKVLHSEVAVSASAVERFFNEARAVNMIEHPSLVQISEFGRLSDGGAYLVMELLRGESLAARLRRGPLPMAMLLQLAWQLADALVAVHDKGIVHRDLKPDNVMLVPEPVTPGGERVKILDFGIAKLIHTDGQKTQSNVLIGTPAYMSPEQCKGAGQVDGRSDIYSLGVVLFEAIVGRPPFMGEFGELIARHLYEPPPKVRALAPHCSPQLSQLIDGMLVKDREQRPPILQVRGELLRLLAQFVSTAANLPLIPPDRANGESLAFMLPPSTLESSVGQTGERRRRRQVGLALLMLCAASGAGLFLFRGSHEQPIDWLGPAAGQDSAQKVVAKPAPAHPAQPSPASPDSAPLHNDGAGAQPEPAKRRPDGSAGSPGPKAQKNPRRRRAQDGGFLVGVD